jgi:hypothetical protein
MPSHIDQQNKERARAAFQANQAEARKNLGTPKQQAERNAKMNAAAAVAGARAYLARVSYGERNANYPLVVDRATKAVAQAEAAARAMGIEVNA